MNNRQCSYWITKYAAANSHRSQHSQPSISLWTVGTLSPHHLWVLFITVWQHVSSGPCHYDTMHWYSPTVLQPGMQNTHAKNKVGGGSTREPAIHPCTHSTYRHVRESTQQLFTQKASMYAGLSFCCSWPETLLIIDFLSVLYLCSAFEKNSACLLTRVTRNPLTTQRQLKWQINLLGGAGGATSAYISSKPTVLAALRSSI